MTGPCRLINYDINPPGGYPYTDPSGREFRAEPMIEAQARIVSDWRTANKHPRPTLRECLEDVDRFTCARLGCMPQFCAGPPGMPANSIALSAASPIVAPCRTCGGTPTNQ